LVCARVARNLAAADLLFVGFNLIVLTTNLIVANYSVAVGNFMLATTGALIVGKAVPVANAMPFIRRYDRAPLIQPILFKTLVYWVAVFIARLLEALVEFWLVQGHPLGEFLPHLASTFSWDHFAAIQIWILVLFLIYVAAFELQPSARRWRAVAHPVHPPVVRAAAEPAAAHPRARPPEPSRRRAFGR
jgi:hypothetical protein